MYICTYNTLSNSLSWLTSVSPALLSLCLSPPHPTADDFGDLLGIRALW